MNLNSHTHYYMTVCISVSRAYVEFYRTSQDSGVLPEVSLSLLLAQQSPSMELSVYPIEQIEICAGNRNITHMKYTRYGSFSKSGFSLGFQVA